MNETVGEVSPDFFEPVRMKHQRILRLILEVNEIKNDLKNMEAFLNGNAVVEHAIINSVIHEGGYIAEIPSADLKY